MLCPFAASFIPLKKPCQNGKAKSAHKTISLAGLSVPI